MRLRIWFPSMEPNYNLACAEATSTMLLKEDFQERFDDIRKLLLNELQWRPHPTCHGKFSVTPKGVLKALDRLSKLRADVLKGLHKGDAGQLTFDFDSGQRDAQVEPEVRVTGDSDTYAIGIKSSE
jgi:hypothetical protein